MTAVPERRVAIVASRPEWQEEFRAIARVLGAALGPLALRILWAQANAAEAYAELKRRLAALGIDRGVYADVKDPACDLIIVAAEDWAARTRWTPPSQIYKTTPREPSLIEVSPGRVRWRSTRVWTMW
jgi:GrpB-like predicted nucleotidyltransferase (UPF0157 family)